MDTNKMREQFEKWALGHFVNLFGEDVLEKDFGGDYVQHNVRMAWVGWKNSREAVAVELPDAVAGARRYMHAESAFAHKEGIDECRKAIEAQGLKVKP